MALILSKVVWAMCVYRHSLSTKSMYIICSVTQSIYTLSIKSILDLYAQSLKLQYFRRVHASHGRKQQMISYFWAYKKGRLCIEVCTYMDDVSKWIHVGFRYPLRFLAPLMVIISALFKVTTTMITVWYRVHDHCNSTYTLLFPTLWTSSPLTS